MTKARTLWVTGGGSGMGRAIATAAARAGWRVAVSGRREQALAGTVDAIRAAGGDGLALAVDTRDPAALRAAHRTIVETWGDVDDVVLSAGLNTPERTWLDQDITEFAAVVDTNLTAVARTIDLVLPAMRTAGSGSIVVVSSVSAWRFSPGSGVAYMASKSALSMICASANDQEGVNGIRATHLCPGEVDTEFLALRPEVPGAQQRALMLTPEDIARSVLFVLESPPHVRIDELVISPITQR